MKRKFLITIILLIFPFNANAKPVADQTIYNINTKSKPEFQNILGSTELYYLSNPSKYYEFIDENNRYNIVYQIENSNDLSWVILDNDYQVYKEQILKGHLSLFGTAIYYNGYLYVLFGGVDTETTDISKSDFGSTTTIELVKYNSYGDVIKTLEISGLETSRITKSNLTEERKINGTKEAFKASTPDMAANNGIIKAVFSREMYSGHQSSFSLYVDANTLEYLNRPSKLDRNDNYYYANSDYWVSHSFEQRVIATSDSHFLTADKGDAFPRAIILNKSYYNESNLLRLKNLKTFSFRESSDEAYGYNSTMANLGNIIELNDGYILLGSSEKTLSLNYAKSSRANESRNIFIQKITKNISEASELDQIQLFNTPLRVSEATRTDVKNKGSFYLSDTQVTDYGIKWLTDLNNKSTVLGLRGIKLKNDNIAIIWREHELISDNDAYTLDYTKKPKYFYEIIDSNGVVVKSPLEIEGVPPTEIINYNSKDNYIYWSQRLGDNLFLNKLDVSTSEEELIFERAGDEFITVNYTDDKTQLEINSNKQDLNLVWSSSNTDIAEVDKNGVVTMKKRTGTSVATITATSLTYDRSISWTFEYKPGLVLNYYEHTFDNLNDTIEITALTDAGIPEAPVFKSYNPTIASINHLGKVTANNYGFALLEVTTSRGVRECIIYIRKMVSLSDGNKAYIGDLNRNGSFDLDDYNKIVELSTLNTSSEKYQLYLEVADINGDGSVTAEDANLFQKVIGTNLEPGPYNPITSITLSAPSANLQTGKTLHLLATIAPNDPTDNKNITWSSSDDSIAVVKDGIVTAKKEGNVVITAETSNGLREKCSIRVYTTSINLSRSSMLIFKGNTEKMMVNIILPGTTIVGYKSSNEKVARVDSEGNITALRNGTAEITVTASEGSQVTCVVTVFGDTVLMGDVDLDGELTLYDVLKALRIALKIPEELEKTTNSNIEAGDFDENGSLDIGDVLYVLRAYLNQDQN